MNKPWTKRLLDVLADGLWHDYDFVVAECCDEVDDDEAFEIGEYYRRYKFVKDSRLVPPSKHGGERTVLTGKHIMISRSVTKLKNRRIVEIRTEPQGRKQRRNKPVSIRLRPEE